MNCRISLLVAFMLMFIYDTRADELQECEKISNSCDFYTCIEKEIPCGNNGYFLGFGERFCRRFDNVYDKLSPKGKIWFFTARQCLTKNILSLDKYSSCQEIEEKSYNDHRPCYINTGYCDLPFADKFYIFKVVYPLLVKMNVLIMGKDIELNCILESKDKEIVQSSKDVLQ